MNISRKINIFYKLIDICTENIKICDENTKFLNKFLRMEEFCEDNEKVNIIRYFESLGIRSVYIYDGNKIEMDKKKIDENILLILFLSQFI